MASLACESEVEPRPVYLGRLQLPSKPKWLVATRLRPAKRIYMEDFDQETKESKPCTIDLRVVDTWLRAEAMCEKLPRALREIVDLLHEEHVISKQRTVFAVYIERTVKRAQRERADIYSNVLTIISALETFRNTADQETSYKITKLLDMINPDPKLNKVGALDLLCHVYNNKVFICRSKYIQATVRAFNGDLVDFWHLFADLIYERLVTDPTKRETYREQIELTQLLGVEWEDMCRV